ncbi:4'-phosphopantetheinyl transferase family protein [Noviherbaspirillum sp.]|uniref:4'-phosphopantetheinyl transferase family protein n=1 Tax=Noviherbaspirillum sp. TaxID=1926288 RepID=UPI002FE04408
MWQLALDLESGVVARLATVLQEEERVRAGSFRFELHRNRYVVCRAVLRKLLGGILDVAPSRVMFRYTDRGKPELDHAMGSNWRFNVSHSGGLALIALARGRRIGIDIELVERDMPDLHGMARIFSDDEQAAIKALPPDQQADGFFRCWARKEAFVKAQGLGITCELKDFSVDIRPDHASVLRAEGSMVGQSHWKFAVLDRIGMEAADYAAALAYEGPPAQIAFGHAAS